MTADRQPGICGSFGCTLPAGHNRGRADIPENHEGGDGRSASVVSRDQLHEAVALTVARCVAHFEDFQLDEHIPQAIFDSLYARQLIRSGQDFTGEAMVTVTDAGEDYLVNLLLAPATGNSVAVPESASEGETP